MSIDYTGKRFIKAYLSSGKAALILKLYLPIAKSESEEFNSAFNSFYDRLTKEYMMGAERIYKRYDKAPRPATLSVECYENEAPVGVISVKRLAKFRFKAYSESLETSDDFDAEKGFFVKLKGKRRFTLKKKKEAVARGQTDLEQKSLADE